MKGAMMTLDRSARLPPRIIPVGEEPPPLEEPAPSSNGQHRHQNGDQGKPKGKTGERFAVLNALVDFALADLTRAEIALWLVLYRDTRDGTARTSYDDLARRAGLNRRNVGRAIRRLEGRGLVAVVRRGGLRRGASRYRVRGQPKEG
jgi:DNA-binding transcriptional ArsR family regulator